MTVIFRGERNGRPVFEFPGDVPPAWLRDLAFAPLSEEAGKPVLKTRGKTYRVGDEVKEV